MTAQNWAELAEIAKASVVQLSRDGAITMTLFDPLAFVQHLEKKALTTLLGKEVQPAPAEAPTPEAPPSE